MYNKEVSREIRQEIRPPLKQKGFSRSTTRSSWHFLDDRIDVINFQSMLTYHAYVMDVTTTRSPLQHPRNPPQLAELTVLRLRFCFNNWKVEDLRPKIELVFVKGIISYYFDPRGLPLGYFF
jgi:hypothetical protein